MEVESRIAHVSVHARGAVVTRAVVIGTQKLKRTVLLYLSNLGGAARSLKVVERVPVSELGDVTIDVLDPGGARIDDDGFARFTVEIPANEVRSLSFSYQIEAAAKVRLPF